MDQQALKKYFRNLSYTGVGNIVYAISQWGILVLATKLGGVENAAKLSLGLAIATPIMLFMGANLKVFIAIDIHHKHNFGMYLLTRSISCAIGILLIIAVGLINSSSSETFTVIILIGIIKVIEGFEEICWGINQRFHDMKSIGISRIYRSIFSILGLGIGFLLANSLLVGMGLWMISWLIILLGYDLPSSKQKEELKFIFDFNEFIVILKKVMPLAFIAGLVALNDKVIQYQIVAILGERALGFFAPMAYIVQGIGLGITSITETSTTRLAQDFKTDRRSYIRNSLLLVTTGFIIGVLVFVSFSAFRFTLLPLFYSSEFLEYQNVFVLLLGIGIIRFVMAGFGVSITAAGKLNQQIPVLGVSLGVTSLTGWLLIRKMGLVGASYSVFCGLLTNLIGTIYIWMSAIKEKNENNLIKKGINV